MVNERLSLFLDRLPVRDVALAVQECLTVWTTESWVSALMLAWTMALDVVQSGGELDSMTAIAD